MKTDSFIASSRNALILAGVIIAVGVALHPDDMAADFVPDTNWQYLHVALGIALILLSLGFAALAARTESRGSPLMTGSFIVFSLVTGLVSGLIFFVEGFVLPVAATDPVYQPLIAEDGPLFGGAMGIVFLLLMVVWSVSAIASGIFIARLAKKHNYTGYLFFAVPLIAFSPPFPHLVLLVGGIVFGAAVFMLGLNFREIS